MFTNNYMNFLIGQKFASLNWTASALQVRSHDGTISYVPMNDTSYSPNCRLASTNTFANPNASAGYYDIRLDFGCTTFGDGSSSASRAGMCFGSEGGVSEDSYKLPGAEIASNKFAISIDSRGVYGASDKVTFVIKYTLTSVSSTALTIGSVGYYCTGYSSSVVGQSYNNSYRQFLMIAMDLPTPITIQPGAVATLTVNISADGKMFANVE